MVSRTHLLLSSVVDFVCCSLQNRDRTRFRTIFPLNFFLSHRLNVQIRTHEHTLSYFINNNRMIKIRLNDGVTDKKGTDKPQTRFRMRMKSNYLEKKVSNYFYIRVRIYVDVRKRGPLFEAENYAGKMEK